MLMQYKYNSTALTHTLMNVIIWEVTNIYSKLVYINVVDL